MNLHQLQHQFLNSIHGDANAAENLHAQLRPSGDKDQTIGIEIYLNNYRGGCVAHLQQTYRVCRQLVGDDAFDFLAAKFVAATPSSRPDINLYGSEFPGFVAAQINEQLSWQTLAYLPDVAQLEWLLHKLYYTPSSSPTDLSQLTRLTPDTLILTPPKQQQLFTSQYCVVDIWQAHDDGIFEGIEGIPGDSEYWLILRNQQYETEFQPLKSAEYRLFKQLASKTMTLPLAAQYAAAANIRLDELLPLWLQRGWLLCVPPAKSVSDSDSD